MRMRVGSINNISLFHLFRFSFQKPLESTPSRLDYYLEAIVHNSLAVAEKCEHQKRKLRIAKACQEVMAKT